MSKVTKYVRTSRFPLPYNRLHRGSLFTIHSEPSRGLRFSKDNTVYRLAPEHEGYFAYDIHNRDIVCLLDQEDKVWPLRVDRS